MKVFPCGATVFTKLGSIEGIITGMTIRFSNVQYEISYFVDGSYKSAWLYDVEFTCKNEKIILGFKNK